MAKAGMRRPDPSDAHGTESNHKMNHHKNSVKDIPSTILFLTDSLASM